MLPQITSVHVRSEFGFLKVILLLNAIAATEKQFPYISYFKPFKQNDARNAG